MHIVCRNFLCAFFLFGVTCLFAAPVDASENTAFEAVQLWQVFKDDPQKAEQTLLGKTVDISGVVVETGMSIYLTPNVRLSDVAGGKVYATCVLPRSDAGLLSSFSKGSRVTMKGRIYRFSANNETVVVKESRKVE